MYKEKRKSASSSGHDKI